MPAAAITLPDRRWRNPRLNGRIPELDGLRGLAILLVLVHHYIAITLYAPPGSWQRYALHSLDLTWSGVDLFFVLSGFLIGGILLDATHAANFYRTFYRRRAHRILPVYCLWLALFPAGLAFTKLSHSASLAHIFNHKVPLWSYALFLQNFAMSIRGEFGGQWLASTWSLAVEEQFYLLLLLAIRYMSVAGVWRCTVAMIAASPILRIVLLLSGAAYQAPYTLLPCRADALGWGVLLALALRDPRIFGVLQSHRRKAYPLILALGTGSLALSTMPVMSVWFIGAAYSCLAAFYALLLFVLVANPRQIEQRLFRFGPLVNLGTVAYAVYIFHQGINYLLHAAVFGAAPRIDGWGSALITSLSLATVLALAAVSWRFLEKPLIRRAHEESPTTSCVAESLVMSASQGSRRA
jgi:peptidoglycan/LPS O-acetylase OafA/YrhL